MNLPAPFNTLSFWKSATFALAGVLALLGYLGYVPEDFVYSAETLLAFALAVFQFFNIEIEERARLAAANLERTKQLLNEASRIRNDLLDVKTSREAAKTPAKRK